MSEILVPIFVAAILPICVVFTIFFFSYKSTEAKMKVLMKAVETGQDIDPEMFAEKKNRKSTKQGLLGKLQGGLVCGLLGAGLIVLPIFTPEDGEFFLVAGIILLAVGVGLLVAFAVGRKFMAKEIAEEENALKK